jgi:hypothetical protein
MGGVDQPRQLYKTELQILLCSAFVILGGNSGLSIGGWYVESKKILFGLGQPECATFIGLVLGGIFGGLLSGGCLTKKSSSPKARRFQFIGCTVMGTAFFSAWRGGQTERLTQSPTAQATENS